MVAEPGMLSVSVCVVCVHEFMLAGVVLKANVVDLKE